MSKMNVVRALVAVLIMALAATGCWRVYTPEQKVEMADAQTRIDTIRAQISDLAKAHVAGTLTTDEFMEQSAVLHEQLSVVMGQYRKLIDEGIPWYQLLLETLAKNLPLIGQVVVGAYAGLGFLRGKAVTAMVNGVEADGGKKVKEAIAAESRTGLLGRLWSKLLDIAVQLRT